MISSVGTWDSNSEQSIIRGELLCIRNHLSRTPDKGSVKKLQQAEVLNPGTRVHITVQLIFCKYTKGLKRRNR